MLRSTGFFRSIDCPYWAGAPGGPCRRPYCHFRHRGARGPGAPGSGGAASPASGLGYDPYNPELPQPPVQRENGALGQGDGMLELELVNQAIEAVRGEVELEQRRYQELLETARGHSAGPSALAPCSPATSIDDDDTFSLALTYTPGGLLSPDAAYQPTPLAVPAEPGHKYSLAPSDRSQGRAAGGAGALEYVPKAVGQPRRCGRPVSGGKYVVDSSKPSTDLEYDPLSNYSARHLGRASARDERATKRPRGSRGAEPYTPALKKPCDPFGGCEARFSDSEDDVTSPPKADVSSPKAGADPESKAPGKPVSKEGREHEDGGLRGTKEMAVQYDVEDLGQPPKAPDTVSVVKPGSPARASQDARVPKEGKAKKKKSGTSASLSHKDKVRKKDKKKEKDPARPRGKEKVCTDKKKLPASNPRGKAQGPEGTKKKPSSATTVASSGKGGSGRPSSTGPQDSGPGPHAPLAWKAGSAKKMSSGKLVERKARSLDEGAPQDTPKLKKRALSHAELFGDESEEEDSSLGAGAPRVWPPTLPSLSSDSESDSDSSLGLDETKVPKRLKAAPPASPVPPSPLSSSSSSSGASQCAEEDVDYSALEKEVDFDVDPMEECLRIFNESTSVKTEDKGRLARQPPKEKAEEKTHAGLTTLFPGQKRRVSHLCKPGKESEAPKRTPVAPPARPPTAQEVCYRRAQLAQRDSASWLQAAPRPTERLSSVHISAPGEKRRIAHVPNPRLAAAPTGAKRALSASSSQASHGPEPGSQPLKTRTLSGMASKTTTTVTPKRIAHSPSLQSLKKPVIPKEFGGKVPTVVRQRYLNLFIEECLKFCSSNQEAIEKALNEEKVAYDRSPSKNIYLNVAVNTLKKLRGLVPNTVPNLSKASGRRVVSHEVVLGGKLAAKTSFSLSRPSSPRVEELKGTALYSRLREYLLTQEQLKENGYPFPHPERPGGAIIFTAEEKKPKDPSCRICCRCGTEYLVSSSGRCVRSEECYYHWGRLRRNRVAGGWETQYMCCSAAVGSVGCQVAKQHVQDGRKENLEGFVRTFQKELPEDAHAGVFALDCEMSYTTYGLELTRVTVVDTDMQVVYDTFVKPDNEVVDYNTRFSGVTEADLVDTSITLRDVQAVLLSMFSADTILIGHSLESDLLALKVIHGTVVDTSVLFPHRLGLPYKRSLRNLMADYLRQIIQDNEFTWEVKANDRTYHKQFKKKGFLCWRQKKYKSNAIHTAKYNIFSFLPLNLYEQFHRMSNLYFLFIIILQGIPEISTLPWFTLFAPLVCLFVIRATRDLVDDIGRHRSDKIINNRPCQILRGKSFLWKKWKNLCVGDVVCLSKDSIVPADLLLLASTEPSSLCYVETADIDGETNLKFRQALTVTHHELTSPKKMASFQGTVTCEEPNSRMHHFVGSLEWNSRKYPLDIGNLLLRGCKIRNTDTCYGLVIYAGLDTKIMKNCGKIHLKRTKLDLMMNKLVALIFLSLVIASLLLTVGFTFMVKQFKAKHYYMSPTHGRSDAMESFFIFWGFLILLSVMVPMAMFIIAEFIYLGNSIFINWDLNMYYEPLDMPAKARSTSLNDQLGQVQYIFSDKTGTLTQNIMTFKKCCINGCIYDSDDEHGTLRKRNPYAWNPFADGKLQFYNKELESLVQGRQDRAVQEFWRLLAICHTVMVQEKDNQLLYQAASPDEEALVTAARNFGYVFLSRTQDTITLVELGEERVYQVLAMMDFNSVRKRMSVLVRNPEGSICLYTKGADTVILERLRSKGVMEATTEEVLAAFAEQTLRTLCLAYKDVEEDAYKEWEPEHQEAALLLQNRAQALHQVYNKMEQNLQLLGATAIEDKLQDGVPETIKCLKKGNIKIWVLTGDKPETAVNIGFACQLLSENMIILEDKDINQVLERYWEDNVHQKAFKMMTHHNMALVINGEFLDQLLLSLRKEPRALVQNAVVDEVAQEPVVSALDFLQKRRISQMWRNAGPSLGTSHSADSKIRESPEVQRERAFVDLASKCQAVICCRVTPKQKALVVALVKKYQQVVTLAIGDGANDVNMIKTADIGVGLAGQEGMQAVQNSDYVLAQFCYLQRLLLVHGRWSYMRVCKFLRYFFYKTVASMMAQIWFSLVNGFSAQPLYEGWFLALFNLLYSTLPVLYIGLFEQDVTAEKSLKMPELYMAGQKGELFNYSIFMQAITHGTITSMINFFVTVMVSSDMSKAGSSHDYQSLGVLVAISSLLSVTLEVMLVVKYWTLLFVGAVVLSLSSYVLMTSLTQSLWMYRISPKTFPFLFADYNVLFEPCSLLLIVLNVALNVLPMLALRTIHRTVLKQRPKGEEEAPSEEVAVEPAMRHLRRGIPARRSSYAFSHREGYANLITQGTILRRQTHVDDSDGGTVCESLNPPEEDIPLQNKDSVFNPRKISILAKKRRHFFGKGSQEEVHPNTSSQTMEKQPTIHRDSETQKLPTTTSATSGKLLPSASEDEAFYSVASQYTLASQPKHTDVHSSFWKSPLWRDSASSSPSQLEVPRKQS